MMELILAQYGRIISTDDTSNRVLNSIKQYLQKGSKIDINANGVVISTKSARIIFGALYKELTKTQFNSKIHFKNASPSFMFAVNEGITTEIGEPTS